MPIDQPEPGEPRDEGADRGAGLPVPPAGAFPVPGRAERLAARARNQERVDAAYQAAADRDAWAEAVPRLRAEWEEHKQAHPERVRASPYTQADGSWVGGDYRRLDPEQNTEAGKAHADLADEAGRDIMPAMRRVEAADPQRRLAGTEYMVKGEDRLKEKLADAWHGRPGLSVGQVLSMVPDAVRFTLSYSSEHYAEGVLADVGRLKAEGFELIKIKNLWHADQYKGVNSQWFRPETGTRFEMQFHTPESLEAKELTHEAYEHLRTDAALPVEEQDLVQEEALESFQRRVNTLVATPPGTDRIKDFPEKKDG